MMEENKKNVPPPIEINLETDEELIEDEGWNNRVDGQCITPAPVHSKQLPPTSPVTPVKSSLASDLGDGFSVIDDPMTCQPMTVDYIIPDDLILNSGNHNDASAVNDSKSPWDTEFPEQDINKCFE